MNFYIFDILYPIESHLILFFIHLNLLNNFLACKYIPVTGIFDDCAYIPVNCVPAIQI